MSSIIDEKLPPDLPALQDEMHEMAPGQRAELKDFILERNDGRISPAHMRLRQTALDVATVLDQCVRQLDIAAVTKETQTICVLSDKLMRQMSGILRAAAHNTR